MIGESEIAMFTEGMPWFFILLWWFECVKVMRFECVKIMGFGFGQVQLFRQLCMYYLNGICMKSI